MKNTCKYSDEFSYLITNNLHKDAVQEMISMLDTVAYGPVARQRPRNKQRDKCSVYSRCCETCF
jgi:hypothetical protein